MKKRKNWLITGISSGLGAALAQSVIESGDFVIGTFREREQMEDFNRRFEGKARSILLDLSDEDDLAKSISALIDQVKTIDVLVNNAGVGFIGAVEEASSQEIRQVFETNFFGTLKLTQLILPVMRKSKSGHIIQISSHGGLKAFAGFGIYNASKFALEGFSEALREEVAPLGIKVTIVEPGPFRTNFAGAKLIAASNFIDDYQTTAGAFRKKLKAVDGNQEGDPHKAADAIINQVESPREIVRLPLGKTALMTIGMKLNSIKADIETTKDIAESVVY